MKSIATNCMPEVVSDLSYDFKKMLESCPQGASWPLWQSHLSWYPCEGCLSYKYVYRLWLNICGRKSKVLLRITCRKCLQIYQTTSGRFLNRGKRALGWATDPRCYGHPCEGLMSCSLEISTMSSYEDTLWCVGTGRDALFPRAG